MVSFKGAHVVKDIILSRVRWYVAYPLSYRQVEELMEEQGPLLNVSTGSDRSIGPRLPMDILVARNSPRKPQTVSLSYRAP
jgi:hypothetical protein